VELDSCYIVTSTPASVLFPRNFLGMLPWTRGTQRTCAVKRRNLNIVLKFIRAIATLIRAIALFLLALHL
jgi:hypothetical protein